MPEQSDNKNIPKHIAIIMDGNGRWAARRGLPRTVGHKHGAEAVRRAVEAAGHLGIQYLTLFGFSSENWARPEKEIRELMKLLRYYLHSETAELHKNGVNLRVIGERAAFDEDIVTMIENAEALTADNTKLHLVIALNYGGKHDIAQAAFRAHQFFEQAGEKPDFQRFEDIMPRFLMTNGMPDPDILIRTSGEMRMSNFLLWQCAYTEFVFTETLWPDFDKADLESALADYARRDRRFGALQKSEG